MSNRSPESLKPRSPARLDVSVPDLEAMFEQIHEKMGPARHSRPFDRLRAEGRSARRASQLLRRRLCQGDGRFLPFLRADGEARGAADDGWRHDVRDELLRRQPGRAQLQCDGTREGGAGSGVPLSGL